jgi:hypothetical protein
VDLLVAALVELALVLANCAPVLFARVRLAELVDLGDQLAHLAGLDDGAAVLRHDREILSDREKVRVRFL